MGGCKKNEGGQRGIFGEKRQMTCKDATCLKCKKTSSEVPWALYDMDVDAFGKPPQIPMGNACLKCDDEWKTYGKEQTFEEFAGDKRKGKNITEAERRQQERRAKPFDETGVYTCARSGGKIK